MLVFSRKRGETIVFTTAAGERITVRVCRIGGDTVRLACDADPATSIHRGEVQERIDRERGDLQGGRAA
jgi:carbon storage regulator CsrA